MLINNESILIIGGEAAEKIISGEISVKVFQKSGAKGFTENSFVRVNPLIQCISPSVTDGSAKVKFSVKSENNPALVPDIAVFSFDRNLSISYEVRSGNETTETGECTASGFKIKPSDTVGKVSLEFIEDSENDEEIVSVLSEMKLENEKSEEEVRSLETELTECEAIGRELLDKKESITEKLDSLKQETAELEKSLTEVSELESRRDVLQKNFEEMKENEKASSELLTELNVFSEILEHYRTEDGFETIKQKLDDLKRQTETITDDIAALAEKRAGDLM